MPGVTIHPPPPSLAGLSPLLSRASPPQTTPLRPSPPPAASSDKYTPPASMSVVDIKNRAKETVRREASKGSAVTLINVARDLIVRAKEKESVGDLHGALEGYIKTATLLRMTMDSTELKQEKGHGVVRKAVQDFLTGVGSDLNPRTQSVEERIKSFEATRQSSNADSEDKPVNQSSGGSIADRMRALQDHGLSISSTKRLPREVPTLPQPPARPPSSLPSSAPISTLPSPAASSSHTPAGPPSPQTLVPTSSLVPSPPHTFVPPSSFGPPSPPSSPPTSPPSDAVTNFNHNFPSIHELEGSLDFNLPSVPTGISSQPSKPSLKDVQIGDGPSPSSSNFGNLALHIERPSSTPITPTINVFNSRPASPTRVNAPHKPSGLSTTTTTTTTTPTANDIPPKVPKIPIPHTNTAFPKDLQKYMQDYTVLIIDVRNRADFDKEHIRAQAVVCIEPSVLLRGNVTAEALEDSMVIAPKGEAKLFSHRDQFDIVAVCDESSRSFGSGSSPLSVLVRVINEQAFRKYLKRMPMLLVGGLEGWKRELGEGEVVHADESQSVSTGSLSSQHSGSSASLKTPNPNLFMNGLSSSSTSGSASSGQFSPPIPSISPRLPNNSGSHRSTMSLDQSPSHTRLPAEVNHTGSSFNTGTNALQRRPAIRTSMSQNGPASPSTLTNGSFSPISYPQFSRHNASASSSVLNSGVSGLMTPPELKSPPPASINPSLTRRRNDYVDQSQEAFSGYNKHPSHIDYPELLPIRPPPAVAASALERQDQRPRLPPKPDFGQPPPNSLTISKPGPNGGPKPPRIGSDYPVTYWMDVQIGLSGLKNLGNTCYMNAPIQCLSATVPFSRFFTEHRWKNAINFTNPLGSKGQLTGAFATLLYQMWGQDLPYLTPIEFRKSICQLRSQYDNSDQHDSQEFLSFLMDGIHEDLNRVMVKPKWTRTPEEEAELERLPPLIASEREWKAWKARNDSIIVDYFQGQFRSRLQCLTCRQTSTTYNVFSILQLPIPHGRNGRVPIEKCLDAFFNEEILEKDDAWDCPKCKTKRRASKTLSLARLPPVLLIHFKRFEANGRFSDKIDTFVEYPMKSLDLTNYMPAPLPPGADKSELNGGLPMSLDDPRSQLPPYRYDLYAVTNHYGNLTSGHYTSFVASRGGWMYCDDSSIKSVEPKSVINQKAYVLFYKRVR